MNKQRRNRIAEALELISQARDILEEVKDEEQESYENFCRRVCNMENVASRCRKT